MTFDERSERNLKTLLPPVEQRARQFLAAANARLAPHGLSCRIIDGSRTYAQQDALYAQGRGGDKRPIVTRAKGGQSNHNFGVAFDVGIFRGAAYLPESEWYAKLGPVGEKLGLAWGGRWKSMTDRPHYEYPTGLTLAQMRARVAKGQSVLPDAPNAAGPKKWSVLVGGKRVAIDVTETGVVRAVAEALGATVHADGAAKAIHLTPAR